MKYNPQIKPTTSSVFLMLIAAIIFSLPLTAPSYAAEIGIDKKTPSSPSLAKGVGASPEGTPASVAQTAQNTAAAPAGAGSAASAPAQTAAKGIGAAAGGAGASVAAGGGISLGTAALIAAGAAGIAALAIGGGGGGTTSNH